jgi:hypothetical protein
LLSKEQGLQELQDAQDLYYCSLAIIQLLLMEEEMMIGTCLQCPHKVEHTEDNNYANNDLPGQASTLSPIPLLLLAVALALHLEDV